MGLFFGRILFRRVHWDVPPTLPSDIGQNILHSHRKLTLTDSWSTRNGMLNTNSRLIWVWSLRMHSVLMTKLGERKNANQAMNDLAYFVASANYSSSVGERAYAMTKGSGVNKTLSMPLPILAQRPTTPKIPL
jgi:hypothetical protein